MAAEPNTPYITASNGVEKLAIFNNLLPLCAASVRHLGPTLKPATFKCRLGMSKHRQL